MATEKQKMLDGEPYDALDPELVEGRRICQEILREFNSLPELELKQSVLSELLARVGEKSYIEAPFVCDYGSNISIGVDSFINYGGIVLDSALVTIGDEVRIATGVQLLTAEHPLDPVARRSGVEMARPVKISDGAWIGGGAIVLPGVTVGENSVIGAGSVVTRDVPANVVAVGNPCRVIREL